MAQRICSKCGYEGRGEPLGERRGGGWSRVLGLLLMLPVHTIWKLAGNGGGAKCSYCGLPTMVKMNSDAGRLARHMLDVELGMIAVKPPEDAKATGAFGNDRPAEPVVKKPVDPEMW